MGRLIPAHAPVPCYASAGLHTEASADAKTLAVAADEPTETVVEEVQEAA